MNYFYTFTFGYRTYHIPERMGGGLRRWVEHGIYPGDFLTALLENDLIKTFGFADTENMENLLAYVSYLYNEMPMACRGSKEIMKAWHDKVYVAKEEKEE